MKNDTRFIAMQSQATAMGDEGMSKPGYYAPYKDGLYSLTNITAKDSRLKEPYMI